MLESPNSYVGGIMLLCCTENIAAVDIYDRFLNVFALVNYVTNMMFTTTGANFYELSSRVLTVFYEHVLRRDFDKRGGWKCLQKYIQDKKFVKYFHDCEKHNFVTDDFPKKLKLKIKDSFSSLSPSISRIYGREDEILSMANDLAKKVTSHVKISPLNDSNSPKLNEEQSTSKETKISNSNKANSLEVPGKWYRKSQICMLVASAK
ncbi:uncharacterized protein TNIN_161321 [Trichonephila inaurata madagascariensis]|uniref:Uncharacterized protein n=1 Tax=Trichonephila inaurata madagascariensis TaxID=2747483 RepID=A0A8X6XFP0_9ARAC|nr:uncharacterized protein TNIN_161321 [Trichonephila inaurata madagascariensis]